MLQRGPTHAFVHVRSDVDASVTASGPVETSKGLRPSRQTGWSGLKHHARRTAATNGLVAVPLQALAPTAGNTSAGGSQSARLPHPPPAAAPAPLLTVGRVGVAAPPPARAHFVAPMRLARSRAAHAARAKTELQPLQLPEEKQPTPRLTAHSAEQRLLRPSTAENEAREFEVQAQAQAHARLSAVQPRLAVPHLPAHLHPSCFAPTAGYFGSFSSPVHTLVSGDGFGSARSASPSISSPRAAITVPDATAIFHRFQGWLASQRRARAEWPLKLAAFEAEGLRLREAREAAREQSRIKKAQRQMARQQRAAARIDEDAYDATPSSTPVPPCEQDAVDSESSSDASDSDASDSDGSTSSAEHDSPFRPTVFSYPRLQYDDPGRSSSKYQVHVVEVTSYEEIHGVWNNLADMLTNPVDSRDAEVRDRVFAFQLEEAPTTGEHGGESTSTVSHGFEDGLSLGMGSKLLHLLQQLQLSDVFVLVTESGGGNSGSGPAGINAHVNRAKRQANMLKSAKIMLQDLGRVRAILAATSMHREPSSSQQLVSYANSEDSSSVVPLSEAGWNNDPPPSPPAVSLFTIPLDSSPPVPLLLAPNDFRFVPPSVAPASEYALPFLSPEEGVILTGEFLALLTSGHAALRMSPSSLSFADGRHKPRFFHLWQAYLARPQAPQERPDLDKLVQSHARLDLATLASRKGFSENEALLHAEATLGSAGTHGGGGRMAASLQPNMSSARRIALKVAALTGGTQGLMLDGFTAEREQREQALSARQPHPPATQSLTLRRGAGFSGAASPSPHLRQTPSSSLPRDQQEQEQARSFAALEEEQEALMGVLAARAHQLQHAASAAGSSAGASRTKTVLGSESDTAADKASQWLELARLRAVQPTHMVQSHEQLFLAHAAKAYAFKARNLLLHRLSRSALKDIAEAHPTHPPFLIRVLVLAVALLIRAPTLHWMALRQLLRGEVPVTALSAFLAAEQASWRAYLYTQESESALPPAIAPERMARSVLAREEMARAAGDLHHAYQKAALFAAQEAGLAPDAPEVCLALDQPRDLLAHLMGVDILRLGTQQVAQVRALLAEPTLTPVALSALPPAHAEAATILYEWILLTLRAHNCWCALQQVFQPVGAQEREASVQGYRTYIEAIGRAGTSHSVRAEQDAVPPLTQRVRTYTKPPIPRQASRRALQQAPTPRSQQHPPQQQSGTNLAPSPPPCVLSLATPLLSESPSVAVSPGPSPRSGTRSISACSERPSHSRSYSYSPSRSPSRSAAPSPLRLPSRSAFRRPSVRTTLGAMNLSTLLASERPAARHEDSMLGSWLAEAEISL